MSEDLKQGTLLGGRYEILEKIGAGGMAVVYKARCRLLNRFVAVKVLRNEFRGDTEFVKRFSVEAQAAASLSHPNIVSIYDVGQDMGLYYIVMEYVEGITLKQYIAKKGALPWREAGGIEAQICSALECAHKNHIIHHDIKPHNIILTKDGLAKVTDFGIARASSSATLVAGGTVMGSAHYFSPEQARGGYTDEKSDIYSAGVVLYEMLTGRVPFDNESPIAIAMMHAQNEIPLPHEINPEIPEAMEQIVLKAMEKEQRLRYGSAADMLLDIDAVLANQAPAIASAEQTRIFPERGENLSAGGTYSRRARQAAQNSGRAKTKKPDKKGLDKQDKRLLWLAIVTGVVVLLTMTFFVLSWTGVFSFGQLDEATVPEIEGLTVEDAEKLLKENDGRFTMEVEEEIASSEYEEGTIISQEPSAGRVVKKGVKILVKVSSGPGDIKIPNVVNYERDSAVRTLEKAGFVVVVTEEESSTVPTDVVIRQTPSAGESAEEGDTVRIYVSKEAEEIYVPNVVGKSLAQAKNEIESAGLVVGNVAEEFSDMGVGTVIRQSPGNGASVSKKSAVALTVSKGRQQAEPSTPPPVTSTPSTPPPSEEPETPTKIVTITVPVPQDKETTQIRIVANGKVIHDELHNRNEGSFEKRVTGTDTATVEIYHDGVLKDTQMITF